MAINTNRPGGILDTLAEALRTYEVQGVVYADNAGSCYRVTQGKVAWGDDYVDRASAQADCDEFNLRAVLLSLREQTGDPGVVEAMRAKGVPVLTDCILTDILTAALDHILVEKEG